MARYIGRLGSEENLTEDLCFHIQEENETRQNKMKRAKCPHDHFRKTTNTRSMHQCTHLG